MAGAPPPGLGTQSEPHGRYYSAREIADLARDVGWRDDQPSNDPTRASELAVAVAIALAESGGDSQATGPAIEHGTAKGLWQIYPADESMFDAERNAQAAWNKYEGAGRRFTPWSVFTSKAYLVKLPAAEIAVKRTLRRGVGQEGGFLGSVGAPFRFIGDIGHDLGAFFAFITSGQTWIRLGEVLGGAVLLLLALYLLFTHTQVGKDVRSVATKGAM